MWSVVTGAGSGIGRAIALELVKHDVRVLAVGRQLGKVALHFRPSMRCSQG